jgi:iron complex outermembrane receptor protein
MRKAIWLVFCLLPGLAYAEEIQDFEQLDLEELLDVVFTAAKHEQDIGESPSAITVITREDIEASGASTVPDLLRMVPGMEVAIVTPYFLSTTSRLFWSYANNHYLVHIDGRETNVDLLGFTPWEVMPIALEDIERIEVIRGPGSSLYGANAFAGVISITTRAPSEKTSAWAGLAGGEAGLIAIGARASTRVGDWGFLVSGGIDDSGNFTNPDTMGRKVRKLRLLTEYNWSKSRRLVADASLAIGSGTAATGVGPVDAKLQIYNLRLAYESPDLRGQLYSTYGPIDIRIDGPIEYSGIRLAKIKPTNGVGLLFDGEIQWTLPRFFEPLLVIAGGQARASNWNSDQFLNAKTYSDPTSPGYHKPGQDHWEARLGAFIHAEISPLEWMTVTAGMRLDYNTVTGEFFSPRAAAVFKPFRGQFFRLGVAQAFRKPSHVEAGTHFMATFPDDSPITGPAQEKFQEFMTRVVGNDKIGNENLLSFDAGYLGRFYDGKLTLSLDLYYTLLRNMVGFDPQIVVDDQGLPDLDLSTFMYANIGKDLDIFGSELSVQFNPSRFVALTTSWTHREVRGAADESPKNLLVLGGRFKTDSGLVGSLYAFSRSEFTDRAVENPGGFFEPLLTMHMQSVVLLLGRLGWRLRLGELADCEVGVKLFLPVSPFESPHFRYREKSGHPTQTGISYGGTVLARMVTGYLQGSF